MTRSPPLRAALLGTLLVLASVAVATPAAATATDRPAAAGADREASLTTAGTSAGAPAQAANTTVLNVTVVGRTAVNAGAPTMVNVSSVVAAELDLDASRVRVDRTGDTVEVLANRPDTEIRAALDEAGIDTTGVEVRAGVSNGTLAVVADALRERIDAAGLAGNASVAVVGDSRLRVRTTAVDRVESTVLARGDLALVGAFPGADGPRRVELVDASGFASVGTSQVRPGGASFVPVTLSERAARKFSERLRGNGFTEDANTGNCRYEASPDDPGYCILTVLDGEVVYAASLSPGLADVMRNGDFVEDPRFVVTAANESTARSLATTLRTGPLPAPLRVTDARTVTDGDAGTDAAGGMGASAATRTASPTPTPTPVDDGTPTTNPTPTTNTTAAAGGGDDGTGTGGQPGFGVLVALVALLSAAGLARRR
jgi:preprotein translocase subunit SecD